MVAIEISAFVDTDVFQARLSELLSLFRHSQPAGESAVRVPGDIEREAEAQRRLTGIPLADVELGLLSGYLAARPAAVAP